MALDYEAIKKAAEGYRSDICNFLRAMISHPSESTEEKEVVECIKAEMEKLGYDKVEVDGLGNIIGWMGKNGDTADCMNRIYDILCGISTVCQFLIEFCRFPFSDGNNMKDPRENIRAVDIIFAAAQQ